MTKEYKFIFEGDFDTASNIFPQINYIGHRRDKRFRISIEVEELEELSEMLGGDLK